MTRAGHSERHLHAIGIGGIGVSALARHYLRKGWSVSGCDVSLSAHLEGATVLVGHAPEHIKEYEPDMVVYSPALPADHPELLLVRTLGIPLYSYPEALGILAKEHDTIAVSGTHGKSTTTALLTHIFSAAKKDPTAIVGARVPGAEFTENYRGGRGMNFIVEGCEYRRGMLDIHPKSAIITNIEADHLDYYKDLSDIIDAFKEYARALPSDGILAFNADDEGSRTIAQESKALTISFGIHAGDCRAKDIVMRSGGMSAMIVHRGKNLGIIESPLIGEFNMMNILAATSMALSYGIAFSDIARAVSGFHGIGRRFESIGNLFGTPTYSDYAHHPTALRLASEAASTKFGRDEVLVIFQPHQIDRTKKLREEFVSVFRTIPHLYVPEIYFVPGREDAGAFSAKILVDETNVGRSEPARFFASLDEMTDSLSLHAKDYKALLFVGAGDIDAYARKIISRAQTAFPT